MNATEDGTHSRTLLNPGDASIQIVNAEKDMVEIGRHIVLRKETGGSDHGRPNLGDKHSSRQQRGRTMADHLTLSLGLRHCTNTPTRHILQSQQSAMALL